MASPKNKEPRQKESRQQGPRPDVAEREEEMAEKKITRKELFARIAEVMGNDPEVVEMCEKEIARLSKPRKPRENKAAIAFAETVADFMGAAEGPLTNGEIAAGLSNGAEKGEEGYVSFQKVAAAIRRLEGEGRVTRIKGEKAKDKDTFALA